MQQAQQQQQQQTEVQKSTQQTQGSSQGVRFGITECRYFPKRLYHPSQMELIYINKGEGLCFAGDGITPFLPGELFFFSNNTPHHFRSAQQFYDPNYPLKCASTYLLFSDKALPKAYSTIEECAKINNLITAAKQGLRWSSKSIEPATIKQIESIEQMQGFERMVQMLQILNTLGQQIDNAENIASKQSAVAAQNQNNAYRDVVEYITHNFQRNITLDELAEHAKMNRTALCRHFKSKTDRSIFEFLLEFRIKYAQQLLQTTHMHIAEIAQEAGFNNLPHFNVQFKLLSNCTPGDYRAQKSK